MLIELRAPNTLKPYGNNPRLNDQAVDAVARSIQEFGFRQPLVVDEKGTIIVGHTRWRAAVKLGLTEVPVHVATGLSPEQAKAYRICDNRTATIAEWDEEKLIAELADLQTSGFDLNLTEFDSEELMRLMASPETEGISDPDHVPSAPAQTITQCGDMWILGRHRLLCGDSTNAADMA